MKQPALVLSTDGVGTKVIVAMQAERFDTVGEDLVNHSVNDILVHGAQPLAFMDYIAGAELGVEQIARIVEGIARGCRAHDMALAGGETAQMPGLYQPANLRSGRHHRRRGRGRSSDSRQCHSPWRSAPGIRLDRTAHQRLYPGAAHPLRSRRIESGRSARGNGAQRGRRSSGGAPQLLPKRQPGARPGSRAGPHHWGRNRRESGADIASGLRRDGRSGYMGNAAAVPVSAAGGADLH